MKLRIKFSKHGVLKFIGHLDVMRYFQKSIRRAEIDIAYSTGFSPHQIMSFAAPLGIGLESNGEYMDIEVNSLTTSTQILETLNSQMVDGIQILEVKLLPENAGNAMASVAAASYSICFREGCQPQFLNQETVTAFFDQPEIIVTKQTKRSESTFDMKPSLYAFSLCQDNKTLLLTVDASSSGNIKPSLVMKAYFERNNSVLDTYSRLITREETYLNLGTAENRKLEPLGFIGSDY